MHCVAGWHCALNAQKWALAYNPSTSELEGKNIEEDFDEWDKARFDWELTRDEADILFAWNATLEVQFALLKYLELGNRITSVSLYSTYFYINDNLKLIDRLGGSRKEIVSPFLEFLKKEL